MVEPSTEQNLLTKESNLLLAYKLSDYKVDPWLNHLLTECLSNAQYKAAIVNIPFIIELKKTLAEQYEKKEEIDMEALRHVIDAAFDQSAVEAGQADMDQHFVSTVLFLFAAYARENQLGPSVYTEYVEETLAPLERKGLPDSEIDFISYKNEPLQDALIKHFERDGECVYHRSQFLIYLFAAEHILQRTLEGQTAMFAKLYKARLSFWIDQHLSSSVAKFMDESLTLYEEYIDAVRHVEDSKKKEVLAYLLAEQHYCQLYFYKYESAENGLEEARKLANLPIQLTGRMGKRTKYQHNNIAQLTLDFSTRDFKLEINDQATIFEEEKKEERKIIFGDDELDQAVGSEETKKEKVAGQSVQLEEDTILYEGGPKFEENLADKELSLLDLTLITAHCHYLFNTMPSDEIRQEMLGPFVTALTKESKNWLLYSAGLLERSRNEKERSKTRERGLAQVQSLIDQFRNQGVTLGEQCELLFVCGMYPFNWGMQKEMGKLYEGMGVFVSAYELYNYVELYEDAIRCLFCAGRETQAQSLATKVLEGRKGGKISFNQANIMCLLGDIKHDHTFYEKAWESSEKRCSRAMRSLGRYYFYETKYEKAVECYNFAFAINKLYPKEWFTCGCAYMRLENWDKAIFAFGVAIQIDERNPEAWGNIANCYNVQKKWTEALGCCEQALKQNRKSWQIWHNMIRFALATRKFYKACYGVNELIRQDKLENLNSQLLLKISELFLQQYALNADGQLNQESLERHKPYLYKFFKNYQEAISDYQVWRLICRIKTILKEDPAEIKEAKMCEVRSLQKANWNVHVENCEMVERALCELIKMFDAGTPVPSADEKAFVRTAALAIEMRCERPFKVEDITERYK